MKTKILITIGPKSESPEILEQLVKTGFDVARMNFSHCTYDEFIRRKKLIEKYAKKFRKKIEILQDLQGPRIRVGVLPKEGRTMREGDIVVFSTNGEGPAKAIRIDYPRLHHYIQKNDPIYLSSGEIELVTRNIRGSNIYAEVLRGGKLHSRKHVNVPDTKLRLSGLTEKDVSDIKFGLAQGVHYIAISFVRTAEDIKHARAYIGTKAKIIAKIESAAALKNIDAIIKAADGIMIARGDLGVETSLDQLPFIQKNLIRNAAQHSKPSIVATQIFTSMITNPNPTCAEVSDLANAVFDGADAVLFSDETAVGNYPVKILSTAVRVITEAESHFKEARKL